MSFIECLGAFRLPKHSIKNTEKQLGTSRNLKYAGKIFNLHKCQIILKQMPLKSNEHTIKNGNRWAVKVFLASFEQKGL